MVKELMDKNNSTINAALLGVIIALLAWNLKTTQDLTVSFAVISEKVFRLEGDIKPHYGQQANGTKAEG